MLKKPVIAILFALLGLVYLMLVTAHFPLALDHDNLSYLEGAQNIQGNHGYTMQDDQGEFKLITHWPPFYSMVLAAMSKVTGTNMLTTAGILAAILFVGAILVLNTLAVRLNFSTGTQIGVNLLFLASLPAQEFFKLQSEGLFILLLLLQTALLFKYLESKKSLWLFLASVLAAACILTRFASIGFMGGVVLLLFLQRTAWATFFRELCIYGSAVIVGFGSWVIYTLKNSSNATDRTFHFHMVSVRHIERFIGTLIHWFSPTKTALLAPLLILLLILMIWQNKSYVIEQIRKQSVLAHLLGLQIAVYIAFLLVSISFFDFSTTFDSRMMAPVFPLLLLWAATVLADSAKPTFLRLAVVLMLISSGIDSYGYATTAIREGHQYTGTAWRSSATIAHLDTVPTNKQVVTNGFYAIRFLTGRTANIKSLPQKLNPNSQVTNVHLNQEFDQIETLLKTGDCEIVVFDKIQMYFLPDKDLLKSRFKQFHVQEFADGFVIY